MRTLLQLRDDEQSLFIGFGCRVQGLTILSEGMIFITDQRVLFSQRDGRAALLERDSARSVTRSSFGSFPAMVIHGAGQTELSLVVADGRSLERALAAIHVSHHAWAEAAAPLTHLPQGSRLKRALRILGMAFAATWKALLSDLGLTRRR